MQSEKSTDVGIEITNDGKSNIITETSRRKSELSSFYHHQPASLCAGYDSPVSSSYNYCDLTTKLKSKRKRNTRIKEYTKWLDFKKPLDERRLCQAVSMNDTATVNHLLNQGVSASCFDSQKRSPLHLAACKGYSHIVKTLLDHGANPNARDSIGNTPLHLAACTNHINVVLLLLEAGTDAKAEDKLGRSPLQLAQSKLQILQRSCDSGEELKSQVLAVIAMLLHFSPEDEQIDAEILSKFQDCLQLSDTKEKVNNQLQDLLNNLETLSIKP